MNRLHLLLAIAAVAGCGDSSRQPGASRDSVVATIRDSVPSAAASPRGCPAIPADNDRTICLDRMGPILRNTNRNQLTGLFPGSTLVDTAVHIGEGQYQPGTIINRGHADSISVIWSDSSRTQIAGFRALGNAWHTIDGLRVGSALAEMERVLGPFAVLGFGWDYGGTAMLANTPLQDSGIFFRMRPRSDTAREIPAYQRVRGDREYPTTSADVRALDLIVGAIDVSWK